MQPFSRRRMRAIRRYPFLLCGLALLLLTVKELLAADTLSLKILPIGPPDIAENKLSYSVKLSFEKCPSEYWWFYDKPSNRIVIEFYDLIIRGKSKTKIHDPSPIKEIQVKNFTTSIVLSGKKTQIHLLLKEPMHCTVTCSGKALQVVLWKYLDPKSVVNQKKKAPFLVPLICIAVGIIATLLAFENYLK